MEIMKNKSFRNKVLSFTGGLLLFCGVEAGAQTPIKINDNIATSISYQGPKITKASAASKEFVSKEELLRLMKYFTNVTDQELADKSKKLDKLARQMGNASAYNKLKTTMFDHYGKFDEVRAKTLKDIEKKLMEYDNQFRNKKLSPNQTEEAVMGRIELTVQMKAAKELMDMNFRAVKMAIYTKIEQLLFLKGYVSALKSNDSSKLKKLISQGMPLKEYDGDKVYRPVLMATGMLAQNKISKEFFAILVKSTDKQTAKISLDYINAIYKEFRKRGAAVPAKDASRLKFIKDTLQRKVNSTQSRVDILQQVNLQEKTKA